MPKKYKYITSFTYLGKRYFVRADSEKELYVKMTEKKRDLKDGVIALDSKTTLDIWSDKVFSIYKSNAKDLKGMRSRYRVHVGPYIGSKPISSIKAAECQEVLNRCEGMSFSTVNKLRQELRYIFDKAIDNEMIVKNPAASLSLPDHYKGERRSITDIERSYFFKACQKDPGFILFIFMLRCGCRPEEAMELQGRDIDHKERLLHIRGTKTKNADRYVPIPADLYIKIKNVKGFDPICPNHAGRRHTEKSYQRLSNSLKREINLLMGCNTYRNALIPPYPLAEDFTPYCLRHTYCTDLCKSGIDVRVAQKLMGHSDISITANIYTHVDMGEILKAREKLDAYIETTQK